MDTSTFLTEEEQAAVVAFVSNTRAFEAVKKVLLYSVYSSGVLKPGDPSKPMHNWALYITNENPDRSDEVLGAHLRAKALAVNDIESAWEKLSEVRTPEQKKEKIKNPAV